MGSPGGATPLRSSAEPLPGLDELIEVARSELSRLGDSSGQTDELVVYSLKLYLSGRERAQSADELRLSARQLAFFLHKPDKV